MKVCDRCKQQGNIKTSTLGSNKFDLCNACVKHIVDHIKNYKKETLFSGLLK